MLGRTSHDTHVHGPYFHSLTPRSPPERLAASRHDARPSQDAGRFVCNCTYYLSLLHSEKARRRGGRPLHTLFLHVPPLAVVALQRQLACLLDLLAAIAQQLAPSVAADGDGNAVAETSAAAGAALAAAAAADDVATLQAGHGAGQAVLAAVAGNVPARPSALAAAAGTPAL